MYPCFISFCSYLVDGERKRHAILRSKYLVRTWVILLVAQLWPQIQQWSNTMHENYVALMNYYRPWRYLMYVIYLHLHTTITKCPRIFGNGHCCKGTLIRVYNLANNGVVLLCNRCAIHVIGTSDYTLLFLSSLLPLLLSSSSPHHYLFFSSSLQ
jgi:hypothetical protein